MASAVDSYFDSQALRERKEKEQQIGLIFSKRLERTLLHSIATKTKNGSGKALKTKVKFDLNRDHFLQRLTITTPYYIYPILNNGFEGNKKASVQSRTKGREFLQEALEHGAFVNDLADQVGALRAQQIVNRIAFSLFD